MYIFDTYICIYIFGIEILFKIEGEKENRFQINTFWIHLYSKLTLLN